MTAALVDALALVVDGDSSTWLPVGSCRSGLSTFLRPAPPHSKQWWFVLTDEEGSRLYAFASRLGMQTDCHLLILTRWCRPSPFFALLTALKRVASSEGHGYRLSALLRMICALHLPPPHVALVVEASVFRPSNSAGATPHGVSDPLLWDGLVALGLELALEAWLALLLERPVCVLSDSPALAAAVCDALLLLRGPFEWVGIYVPALPDALLGYLEAPTPFLIGASRTAFTEESSGLDVSMVLVIDVDSGRLMRPCGGQPDGAAAEASRHARGDLSPSVAYQANGLDGDVAALLRHARLMVEPLVPLIVASRHPRVNHLSGTVDLDATACEQRAEANLQLARHCFGALLHDLLHPESFLVAVSAAASNTASQGVGMQRSALDVFWKAYTTQKGSSAAGAACTVQLSAALTQTMAMETLVATLLTLSPAERVAHLALPEATVAPATVSLHIRIDDADSEAVPRERTDDGKVHDDGARDSGTDWGRCDDGTRIDGALDESIVRIRLEAGEPVADQCDTEAHGTTTRGQSAPFETDGIISVLRRAFLAAASGEHLGSVEMLDALVARRVAEIAFDHLARSGVDATTGTTLRLLRARCLASCGKGDAGWYASLNEVAIAHEENAKVVESVAACELLKDAAAAGMLRRAMSIFPAGGALAELAAARLTQNELNGSAARAADAAAAASGRAPAMETEEDSISKHSPTTASIGTDALADVAEPESEATASIAMEAAPIATTDQMLGVVSTPATPDDIDGIGQCPAAQSSSLSAAMIALFVEHADSEGCLRVRELSAIGSSPDFNTLAVRHAGAFADMPIEILSSLDCDALLAFWLNIYNFVCMQGMVAAAASMSGGYSGSAFRIFSLHRRFECTVCGMRLSALEIEHAVLRASQPRPSFSSFFGAQFLIPKFGASDPRRQVAINDKLLSPLLAYGLVAGTAFSPALRAYDSDHVHAQLAKNAQRHFADAVQLLERSARMERGGSRRVRVRLPIQLFWHQSDLGADMPSMLAAIAPLVPSRVASAVAAQKSPEVSYEGPFRSASWAIEFKVPTPRDSDVLERAAELCSSHFREAFPPAA